MRLSSTYFNNKFFFNLSHRSVVFFIVDICTVNGSLNPSLGSPFEALNSFYDKKPEIKKFKRFGSHAYLLLNERLGIFNIENKFGKDRVWYKGSLMRKKMLGNDYSYST